MLLLNSYWFFYFIIYFLFNFPSRSKILLIIRYSWCFYKHISIIIMWEIYIKAFHSLKFIENILTCVLIVLIVLEFFTYFVVISTLIEEILRDFLKILNNIFKMINKCLRRMVLIFFVFVELIFFWNWSCHEWRAIRSFFTGEFQRISTWIATDFK